MKPYYIDTHAHLYHKDYKEELSEILSRALDAGVCYCIIPGTDIQTSREAVESSMKYENVFACVGIHPHDAGKASDRDVLELEELCKNTKVVGIGEIGLDYYYDFSPRDEQKKIFSAQLDLAALHNLPVVIHTRESFADVFECVTHILQKYPNWKKSDGISRRGVFHCFPGSIEDARAIQEIGFYISYPGIVTFKKSTSMEVVRALGLDNMLLETDSPYMTPVPLRGKRNEPSYIVHIGRAIATALQISEEEVAKITSKNACDLFGLKRV